ncbi:cohesin subunit [Rhizophagus clarus]|uniref:Cohesin subunit n=1 Tax=Rhizophagus clarus TaxID=94130 RepID=A0A8H3QDQ5_9GLOM|nr:cohesin subunit [Rhizophagus clarus]
MEMDIGSQPSDNEEQSEKTQDKVSESETETSTKTSISNLRRSTRPRKPPSWLLQDETSTTRRKSRRIDNNDEIDYDNKNVSDIEVHNNTNTSSQDVRRKRGRPRKSSTANSSENNDINVPNYESNTLALNAQKKRGRPRKNSSTQSSEKNSSDNGSANDSNTVEPKIRQKRGGSKKDSTHKSNDVYDKNGSDGSSSPVPEGRKKRGRTKNVEHSEDQDVSDEAGKSNTSKTEAPKKRGRPKKNSSIDVGNDRDKEVAEEEISNISEPEIRRKRERSRKNSSTQSSEVHDKNSSDDEMNNNETNISLLEVRRKRGRPKKSSTVRPDPAKLTETRRVKKSKTDTRQNTPENVIENSPENISEVITGTILGETYESTYESAPENSPSLRSSIANEQNTVRSSRDHLEDSGLSLYQTVLMPNVNLENIVSDWVETYEIDNQRALLILLNFIIRSCGCPETIEKEAIKDEDAIVDVLNGLQNAFKKELITDYPLVSKAKDFKKFRKSLLEFFHRLIKQVKHSILYDSIFCETIYAWVCSMSSSAFRPFRHTATAIALFLLSCLCEVAQEVQTELNIATRQLTSEQIKNKNLRNLRNQDRMSSLRLKTTELTEKKQRLEIYFNDFFNGVFIHRYRDVEAIIRAECVKELGVWIIKYPDRFLEDKVTRYLGWQLSDKSPVARIEAIKSLSRLYINETFISGLRNFTERFKPRLIEMASRESELGVRTTTISLLTQIYRSGLLDDEDRDDLSLLIYSDLSKVRKAIAPFVKDLLDEDFISSKLKKVQNFLSSNGVTKRRNRSSSGSNEVVSSVKRDWVAFKCLAEFLVKYRKPTEIPRKVDEMNDEINEINDSDEYEDGSSILSIGDVKNNRIALAIEALWNEMEILHDWHSLAEYLSKDHSLTNSSGASKDSQEGDNHMDAIEDCYRLSEREESVLVQVLVACLKLILTDPLNRDKKKTEVQIEEIRDEVSRTMVHTLPRLLTKYAPDAGKIAEVLQIPPLMNLQVYSELRMLKAYELLIEDVKKLFLKHTHPLVLTHAVRTFSHMETYESFASTTEANLGELQEEVIQTFIKECDNKELLTMELTCDQVHSLGVALTRFETLIGYKCIIDVVEECDDNRKDIYSCFIELIRRGLLNNVEEQQMVCSAISCIWNYLLWKANEILMPKNQPASDISPDKMNDLIVRRDQIVQTLFEVGVSISSEAPLKVKTAAFSTLELQERIEQFVTEEIGNFRNTVLSIRSRFEIETKSKLEDKALKMLEAALNKRLETKVQTENERFKRRLEEIQNKDDRTEQESEKLKEYEKLMLQVNETLKQEYDNFKEQEYERLKKLMKNMEIFVDPEEKQQILDIIGTLSRGVRGGWFQESRVAIVMCQLGTLISDLDNLIKKLIQDFKDLVLGGEAKSFANICISSLKKSHELYVEGHVDTMNGTTSLVRLCTNALQLRETIDKTTLLDKSEEVMKAIKFFKILSMLVGGMKVKDAQQIYSILQQEMNTHEIHPSELDKQWEPYYLYVQKLNNIMTKGGVRIDNSTGDPNKRRSVNNTKKRNAKHDHIDSNSENQENYEGIITSTKERIAMSSFGVEDTNNSLVDSNEKLTGNKRSAPIDDDDENLRSPKKRKPTNNRRRHDKDEEEVSNGEGNELSDSGESFQSLADVRTKKKIRR